MLEIDKRLGEYKDLVYECKNKVERFGSICSFFVHGSRATKRFHNQSDLDLCFVVDGSKDNVKKLKFSLRELFGFKRVGVYYLNGERWNFWMYKNKEVGVHVYTKKEVEGKISRLYKSFEDFESVSPWIQHTIRESYLIYDKGNYLEKWKKKVESFPEKFFREYRKVYLDYLEGKLEWMDLRPVWKGETEEILDTLKLYEVLIKCHYAFNPEVGFYMPGGKNYVFDEKLMRPKISKNLAEMIKKVGLRAKVLLSDKRKQKEILIKITDQFVAESSLLYGN